MSHSQKQPKTGRWLMDRRLCKAFNDDRSCPLGKECKKEHRCDLLLEEDVVCGATHNRLTHIFDGLPFLGYVSRVRTGPDREKPKAKKEKPKEKKESGSKWYEDEEEEDEEGPGTPSEILSDTETEQAEFYAVVQIGDQHHRLVWPKSFCGMETWGDLVQRSIDCTVKEKVKGLRCCACSWEANGKIDQEAQKRSLWSHIHDFARNEAQTGILTQHPPLAWVKTLCDAYGGSSSSSSGWADTSAVKQGTKRRKA